MSRHIAPTANISQAWVDVLEKVNAEPDGTATNVMITVEDPLEPDILDVRSILDSTLASCNRQQVSTVANTLFPSAFYADPGFVWAPEIPHDAVDALDAAAEGLYREYGEILPSLRRVKANQTGTYFSRMVQWPGKTGAGVNQLQDRIHYFRAARRGGQGTHNASDIAIAGDAELSAISAGIQEYAASDKRQIGFPCLVHIDLSAHSGVLALTAVYRHWHLITRGYGNLVGLARLQAFLAQQSGFEVGELVVLAGYANTERGTYGGKRGVTTLVNAARGALDTRTESVVA
jgi:hypothetical protein